MERETTLLENAGRVQRMHGTLQTRIILVLLVLGASRAATAGPAEDQYAVAARLYSHSRWQSAADEFAVFLKRFPEDQRAGTVEFFLGESLVQLGRYDRAKTHFQQYLMEIPTGEYAGQALFRVGEAAYLAGDYKLARSKLEQFQRERADDPLNAHVLDYLGTIALDDEQTEQAKQLFQDCLTRYPNGPQADHCRFGLARALEASNDVDGALRFYGYLGEQEASPLRNEARLQQAIVLYRMQRLGEAVELLQTLRDQTDSGNLAAHIWYWLGTCQMAGDKWADAAKTLAEGAAKLKDPHLVPAMHFLAAEAFRQMDDLSSARSQYDAIVQKWSDSRWADDSLQMLVQLAWQDDNLDQVDQLASQFIERYPTSPLRWIVQQTVGRARIKRGEYQLALEVLEPLAREKSSDDKDDASGGEIGPMPALSDRALAAQRRAEHVSQVACTDPANWYYLAVAQLGLHRFQDALDSLTRIQDVRSPEQLVSGVCVARAAALVGTQQFAEAISPLKAYLAAWPHGDDADKCRAQLAVALEKTGQWDEMPRIVSQMRERAPHDPLNLATIQYLADAAYRAGKKETARQLYEFLADDANPPEYIAAALSGLAWIQWEAEPGSPEAAEVFEQLLRRYPDSPLAAEAAMMRGRSLQKQGAMEAALGMYHLVIDKYADSEHAPVAALAAAGIHDRLDQDSEAERLLRALVKDHPGFRTDAVWYQLAWVLVDLGRSDEANQLFERIHVTSKTSRYWTDSTYRLAQQAARAGQRTKADALAAEILQSDADARMRGFALYLQGQLAARSRQWDRVVESMSRLLKQPADSPLRLPARFWLAEAHFRLRHYKTARKQFDQLQHDTKGRSDPWLAMVLLRRAQLAARQHQWETAFELAQSIPKRFPNFHRQYEADYVLGRYFASRAQFSKARAAYQRVVDSDRGGKTETASMAQWMIGETYFLQKEYDQAIQAYFRVEALYDYPRWQAIALLQAGKCQEMVGRWDEASRLYAQILEDYSKTPIVEKASQRLRVAQQRAEIATRR